MAKLSIEFDEISQLERYTLSFMNKSFCISMYTGNSFTILVRDHLKAQGLAYCEGLLQYVEILSNPDCCMSDVTFALNAVTEYETTHQFACRLYDLKDRVDTYLGREQLSEVYGGLPKSDIIETMAEEIGMAIDNKTLDVIIKDIRIYADTKKNSDEDKYEIMKIAQNLLKDMDKYK